MHFYPEIEPSSSAAVHKWPVWLTGILINDDAQDAAKPSPPVARVWAARWTGATAWAGHPCGCPARLMGPGGPAIGLSC